MSSSYFTSSSPLQCSCSFTFCSISNVSLSKILRATVDSLAPSLLTYLEPNTPVNHKACQELSVVHVSSTCLPLSLLLGFCVLSGCFVLTFGVPTLSALRDVPLEVAVRLLARSSCLSKAPDSAFSAVSPPKFLAQIPSTHPLVIAFASASAELNDVVACTLLCVNEYSHLSSTPPEVEHLVFGHPLQTLSTTTLNFLLSLSVSLCQPTETEHKSWSSFEVSCKSLNLRANLLTLLQTPHCWVRDVSHHFFRLLCRISFRECTGTVQITSGSLSGSACPVGFLQMFMLPLMILCCLGVTTAFAWPMPELSSAERT